MPEPPTVAETREPEPEREEIAPGADAPTVAESPHARHEAITARRTGSGKTGGSSTAHSAAAERALRNEELMRTRSFARTIGVLSALALIPVVAVLVGSSGLGTPRWLQIGAGLSLALSASTGIFVWLRMRTSRRPQLLLRVFAIVCVWTSLFVQVYAGLFSPAPTLIALGISYFGLLDDRLVARMVCLGATAIYALLCLLLLAGVMPDWGLFPSMSAPLVLRLAAVGTVLSVFVFMFWQTRESRLATHLAVERLDEALRAVQEREALLDEANQNLDQALAAGGRRGGYSGRLVGPYRLGELLGRGGMGEVYAAAHQQSGATAAVKLLTGSAASQRDLVQRFLREAELARRLRSPNLVEIMELGESAEGAPYLAMELLRGHDLGWHLRRQRLLPLAEVVVMTMQVSRALDVAHAAGIVHRDLKPANLFRLDEPAQPESLWKVLDFGVAKLAGSTGTLTHRALIGTPGYMSPEQAQGHDVDARSDVFSLGSVIYRALTGRPPFSAPDTPQVLFDVVYKNPVRPSEMVSLPADVDLVLALALAKHHSDRLPNASLLASALAAAAEGQLAPKLRARAQAVLKQLPWNRTVKPR